MRLIYLAAVATAAAGIALAGCAHESGGRSDDAGLMKAESKDCAMHRESGPDQSMSGCGMMSQAKKQPPRRKAARAAKERDPHADHRPK